MEGLESRRLLASITWANAAGQTNWSSGASWVGGVAPSSADTAVFPSAASIVQPALTANASVAGITINNSGADYNIGGSSFTLTLGTGGVALSSPSSTTASTSTVSPALALSASTTFSATNNTGVNTLTLSGTLAGSTYGVTKSNSGTVNFNGAISGSGTWSINSGIASFAAANTRTGTTQLMGGTSNFTAASSLAAGTVWMWGGQLNSNVANAVSGTTSIQVANASSVATFLAASNRTGTTVLSSGALELRDVNAHASSTLYLNGGTLRLRSNAAATFNIPNVEVGTTGPNVSPTINVDRVSSGSNQTLTIASTTFKLDYSLPTLNVTGANGFRLAVGTLLGQLGGTKRIAPTTAAISVGAFSGSSLELGGSASGSTIGVISGAGNSVTLNGTGDWTFTGANTYTGATSVTGGSLLVNGSTASGSAVTVGTGATLGGTGTVNGAITVQTGGTLNAGAVGATGILNTASLTFSTGSSFAATINSSTAGSGYDQTNVVGTVSLGGSTLTLTGTRTTGPGQQIQIITNDGTDAVTGTFNGLAEGASVVLNGVPYTISYVGGTGNDVVLTDAGSPALANMSPWGVSTSANSSGTYTTWMPQMASAGVKWVRNFPEWGGIEPTNDGWNLTGITNLMNAADTNNMFVSGMFMYAASWLGIGHHVLPTSTTHLDEYKEYVAKVVDHTAGRIDHYEVWNEPNSTAFATNGTPANYAAVVNATWEAAKAENPNVQLGLTVADYDVAYLKNVIQAGAGTNFDFIAVHPYSILGSVEGGQEALYMSIVPTLRKMLQEVAPSKVNVPIWFTEIGIESDVVGTDRQARDVVKAYSMGIAQGVQRINWYEAKDGQSSFGLVSSGGTTKTAHAALDRLEAALGQTPVYKGWVQLNSQDYGFVFQGPGGDVLVTWAPSGTSNSYNFGSSVNVLDTITGVATNGVTSYTIGTNPVIVSNIPASLVTTAQGNINTPLTWGGNYSGASSISLTTGATHTESGLHYVNRDGRSMTVTAYGATVRYAGAGTPSATSESFTSSGTTIASAQTGYTGTGYLQFSNTTGSYVEWTGTNNNASTTLTRRVRIRYANGDAASRTMTLTATRSGGGVEVTQTVTFPTTGGWNQWRFMDINVVLPAKGSNGSGAFTIRTTTNGTSTGPFLDFLNNGNAQQLFTIDPAFLSYTHTGVTISVETKRIESAQNAGYNLKYESVNGVQTNYGEWKTIGTSSDPNVWSTQTFYVDTFNGGTFVDKPDTQFVGNWGYHFLLDSDGIENSSYYIRSVTVTKGAALSAAIDYVDDNASAPTLRMSQVTPGLELAKRLWSAGDRDRRDALRGVEVRIEDLPGRLLGTSYDNIVVLDADAAGLGWSTSLGKAQKGKIDLLTVLSHELGHVLGFGHADADEHAVMSDGLATGVRLMPNRGALWSHRPLEGTVAHEDDDWTPSSRWADLGL